VVKTPSDHFRSSADRLVETLCNVCLAVSGTAALVLLAIGTIDVVGTQFLGRAVPSAIELQESFAAVLIFTGFAVAQQHRAHLGVDLLTERLRGKAARIAEAFALLCTVAVFMLLTMQAYALAARSVRVVEHSPGFLGFPVYPFKVTACLACAIAAIETARQLVHVLRGEAVAEPAFDQKEILP
jgi:TRAP-type C4-dicarboxylate transport system permease small subunit